MSAARVCLALLHCAALAGLASALRQAPSDVASAAPSAPASWKEARGPLEAAHVDELWRDESRGRDVPVRIWHPVSGDALPIVIFSHGLGGARENYAHLGQHWASHGYAVVHVQHLGSDDAIWRDNSRPLEAAQRAVGDIENLLNRPRDVSFALDELERRSRSESWPLRERLDLTRVAVAGHSFGAYTALCSAGRDLVIPLSGARVTFHDARIDCAIAMSPQGKDRERSNRSWERFATPVLHMTGTRDESPIRGDATPAERRIPFDTISKAEQYLLILEGAQHHAFGDSPTGRRGARDPAHEPLILSSSTAFLDAYLRGDARALAWLRDGGFVARLGQFGTFESKSPAAAPPADADGEK